MKLDTFSSALLAFIKLISLPWSFASHKIFFLPLLRAFCIDTHNLLPTCSTIAVYFNYTDVVVSYLKIVF